MHQWTTHSLTVFLCAFSCSTADSSIIFATGPLDREIIFIISQCRSVPFLRFYLNATGHMGPANELSLLAIVVIELSTCTTCRISTITSRNHLQKQSVCMQPELYAVPTRKKRVEFATAGVEFHAARRSFFRASGLPSFRVFFHQLGRMFMKNPEKIFIRARL